MLLSPPSAASSSPSVSTTVRKRDGAVAPFDPARIATAIAKAFRAELGFSTTDGADAELPPEAAAKAARFAAEVVAWCQGRTALQVERVQDEVERTLMQAGEHRVARRYVLYREQRAHERRGRKLHFRRADGTEAPFDPAWLRTRLEIARRGLPAVVAIEPVLDQATAQLYPGIGEPEIMQAAILASRARIELEPDYTYLAARLLLGELDREVLGPRSAEDHAPAAREAACRQGFQGYIARAVEGGLLDPALATFDLPRLAAALEASRDERFAFLGVQTLYDRYFLRLHGRPVELPQWFWMRIAMGLALGESDREGRAIEFYALISQFRFTPATPTLFNSGTRRPQLSSCYLTTVDDDLQHIFKCIGDNAQLSKWAGGLGNDWTRVRALGAVIHGTGGKSQGVVPFLKIVSDAAVAVNQGGKRKGAVCAYLETWHLDVEEFLELRKNTGDDRRRTHDLHTANWIPDLFMKRVLADAEWTLFSPDETPELHELFGAAFEAKYQAYEQRAAAGGLHQFKKVRAVELWRKMLSMLFETGHPWITFKDPSNLRSAQDHVGVVHNSNLCTEILLNNSGEETAVCNLGSINLAEHVGGGPGGLDLEKLQATVRTAVRMLDDVVDLNYYPTPEARRANLRHRPVGLGVMGFQDLLHALGVGYGDAEAVEISDRSMEAVSYYAIAASAELARERGPYSSYYGSKWSKGLLPFDTLETLEQERGAALPLDRSSVFDWNPVRKLVAVHGVRNSCLLAIAPTATIANIVGVGASIEPSYRNLYVKSNLSGEFTQVNRRLVEDLRALGLWDADMLDELKYHEGALGPIDRIPEGVKRLHPTAFDVGPEQLIECAARRQKWIDMGQSLNLYLVEPSGKRLHEMYFLAWRKGLKTTYYLRTLAATQVEKSTLDVNRWGVQPRWMKSKSASSEVRIARGDLCSTDGECEACQ